MAGLIHQTGVSPGDGITARSWNRMNTSLSRGTVQAGSVHDSAGFASIPIGLTTSIRLVVLRTVELLDLGDAANFIEVQETIEEPDETKLAGEANMVAHIGAVGGVFEAFPMIGGHYPQYNIEGAIRPVADIVEPENLSGATLFEIDGNNRLKLIYRWAANLSWIDPNASEVGGGGV